MIGRGRVRRLSPPGRHRPIIAAVAVATLVALAVADHRGHLLVPGPSDMTAYHGVTVRVSRVLDGDTIDVDLPDPRRGSANTRVRLWGISCPELARHDRPAEPGADAAHDRTQSLLHRRQAVLTLEPHRTRDLFGRILAHVQLPDGTRVNEVLLADGYGHADERWPHAELDRYGNAEGRARRADAGVWAP